MRKHYFILSIFLFNYIGLIAQAPFKFVSGPSISNSNGGINNTVNNFTGTMNASVPIYSYKSQSGNLGLSVSLDYNGVPLNLMQNPSAVGTGWTLNAGNQISRAINGLPDDLYGADNANCRKGYLYTPIIPDNPCPIEYQGIGYYDNQFLENKICKDSEWDNFIINGQGSFIIPKNSVFTGGPNKVITIPQSNLDISPESSTLAANVKTSIGKFVITDDKGIRYWYDAIETIQKKNCQLQTNGNDTYSNCTFLDEHYVVGWKLSKMKDIQTGEEINFTYEDYTYSYNQYPLNTYFNNSTHPNKSGYHWGNGESRTQGIAKRLKSISFNNGISINFLYDYIRNRCDVMYDRALREIEIVAVNGQTTRYRLNQAYQMFSSDLNYLSCTSSSEIEASKKWLILKSVDMVGPDQKILPVTKFEYITQSEKLAASNYNFYPRRFEPNVSDLWFEYRGCDNSLPITQPCNNQLADYQFYREIGLLRKIISPYGGYTQFDYEPNIAVTPTDNTPTLAAGVRIKKITVHDNIDHVKDIVKEYNYVKTDGTFTSGFRLDLPSNTYQNSMNLMNGGNAEVNNYTVSQNLNMLPMSGLQSGFPGYSRIEEVTSQGKIISNYRSFADESPLFTTTSYPFPNKQYLIDWSYGLLTNQTIKDASGNTVSSTDNSYNIIKQQLQQPGFKAMKMAYQRESGMYVFWSGNMAQDCIDATNNYQFRYEMYYPYTGRVELTKVKQFDFLKNNTIAINEKLFEYDPLFFSLRKVSSFNSKKERIDKILFYPYDYNINSITYKLKLNYNFSTSVGSIDVLTKTDNSKYIIGLERTDFQVIQGTMVKPLRNYSMRSKTPIAIDPNKTVFTAEENYGEATNKLASSSTMDVYDNEGKLLQSTTKDVVNSLIWDNSKKSVIASVEGAKQNDIFFANFEQGTGWDSYLTGHDNTKFHTGRFSGRIDRTAPGEQVCLSTQWLNINNLANTKYKFSGWVYTNGPHPRIYLFMRIAGETNLWTTFEFTDPVGTGKWVYFEKEVLVNNSIKQLNIRIDNWGGGSIWYDDISIRPSTAQMTTYTCEPLAGLTSQTDPYNKTTFNEYDGFGRLSIVRDNDNNVIKRICYNYQGQPEDCSVVTGPIIIYARIEYESFYTDIETQYCNLMLRFYRDEGCSLPFSVNNLSVNYQRLRTNCDGSSPLTTPYSVVCNGTETSLGTQILWRDTGIHCWYYEYTSTNGSGYVAQ